MLAFLARKNSVSVMKKLERKRRAVKVNEIHDRKAKLAGLVAERRAKSRLVAANDSDSSDDEAAAVIAEAISATLERCDGSEVKKKRQRVVLTWTTKAVAIFMFLHPLLLNKDAQRAADMFSVSRTTLVTWLSKDAKRCDVPKWFDMVKQLTWGVAKQRLVPEIVEQFDVPDELSLPEDELAVYEPYRGKQEVLSVFNKNVSSSSRGAKARHLPEKFVSLNDNKKQFLSSSNSPRHKQRKYLAECKWLKQLVQQRWLVGDPISMAEIHVELTAMFGKPQGDVPWVPSKFYASYLDPQKKTSARERGNWIRRVLRNMNFSVRKKTVSQNVPVDWRRLAEEAAADIRQAATGHNVTHIVNADQTFIIYFPEATHVIAPMGQKRIGSKVKYNSKQGCTLMVAADYHTGLLLNPFMVMHGKTGGTLDKRFQDWKERDPTNTCYVTFQAKHWFDAVITVRWLTWLRAQYPAGSVILLIWDHAPAHDSAIVKDFIAAASDWLVVKLIPGGLTSVMQVCDLSCNAPLKRRFKSHYTQWRAEQLRTQRQAFSEAADEAEDAGVAAPMGFKPVVKRDRAAVVNMVQKAFKGYNDEQLQEPVAARAIRRTFVKAGQDPYAADTAAFTKYLNELEDHPVYGRAPDCT